MKYSVIARAFIVSALVLVALAVATPASAQGVGTLRGKVVDASGKGIPDVEITLNFVGDRSITMSTKTDSKGEFTQAGLQSTGGRWNLVFKKGDLTTNLNGVIVRTNEVYRIPNDVRLAPAGAPAAGGKDSGMSKEEAAAREKKKAELEAKFAGANADITAGNYDAAITKIDEVAAEIPKCAACSIKKAEAYMKKGDDANAEKFFLEAIEFEPTNADPYKALATIYNAQKKFDEAGKMGAKANELLAASGGGDAASVFNTGIIFWNQSKAAEAQAQFEQAVKLDPKMADAHFYLGMSLVNQGKMAEAKAPLQEYLKLAPTGKNAEQAKAIIALIK
jgi:Flp pilus assembly protein TadD